MIFKPTCALSPFQLSYTELSASIHDALHYFKIMTQCYLPQSICDGCETFEWINNIPLQDVMMNGRLEAEPSCKQYVNAAKDILVRTAITSR